MKRLLFYNQDIFSRSMEDLIREFMEGKLSDRLVYPGYVSVIGFIWYYLGVFLFIMLIQYLFSNTLKKAADKVLHQTLRSLLTGLLFFSLVPVLISLLMATLLGLPLALLILIAYVSVILLVIFISSVSVANWISRFTKGNWSFWLLCAFSLVVFLSINLLLMVPVVGWIVLAILSCMALGSILLLIDWKINRQMDS